MNRKDLFCAIGEADEDMLAASEAPKRKKKRLRLKAFVAAAAALFIAGIALFQWKNASPADDLIGKETLMPTLGSLLPRAVAEAEYPEMPPYPEENSRQFYEEYNAWRNAIAERKGAELAQNVPEDFFINSVRQLLKGSGNENRAYSPLNAYMALGMLAEVSGGETRQQILSALGEESIENLRARANAVWNAHYRNDAAAKSVLAGSIWMSDAFEYREEPLLAIREHYYASSFAGKMGSQEYDQMLRDWLNRETGGLLEDAVSQEHFEDDTLLAMAATLYFRASWQNNFIKSLTAEDTFFAPDGEIRCDFMKRMLGSGAYWQGEAFTAVQLPFAADAGSMRVILPNEGVSVDALIESDELFAFIFRHEKQWVFPNIHLTLPKFDVTCAMDLQESLAQMGITNAFDPKTADFTPIVSKDVQAFVSRLNQSVRVVTDEESVTAAAYTVAAVEATGAFIAEEVDFIVNRPFIFVIDNNDGLPLFVGVVNRP